MLNRSRGDGSQHLIEIPTGAGNVDFFGSKQYLGASASGTAGQNDVDGTFLLSYGPNKLREGFGQFFFENSTKEHDFQSAGSWHDLNSGLMDFLAYRFAGIKFAAAWNRFVNISPF